MHYKIYALLLYALWECRLYSRQLPWGILISYHKWNEMNFISFTVNISSLILNAISFTHKIYFICSKFYFIHSWHLFHSPTGFRVSLATITRNVLWLWWHCIIPTSPRMIAFGSIRYQIHLHHVSTHRKGINIWYLTYYSRSDRSDGGYSNPSQWQ